MEYLREELNEHIERFIQDRVFIRKIYFYPDELKLQIPDGKLVEVTIKYVSRARIESKAE